MSAPRAAAGAGAAQRPVLTSVVLQGALYFGKLYDVIYFVLSFLIFLYKGFTLPYPDHIFGMEFTYLFLWLIAEPCRCFLCSKGNLTETLSPLVWSVGLGVPIVLLYMYFLTYQTYVLQIDLFLSGVAAGFLVVQVLLTLFLSMTIVQQRRA